MPKSMCEAFVLELDMGTPEDTHSRASAARNPVYFVALVVFIDMMGVSIIIPVMPALIRSLSDVTLSQAAEIGGYLFVAYATMQLIFAPILGALSDRFGRRPVLLVALTGLAADYLIMAFAPSLVWLFVGRFLAGIMGATWPVANACAADVSTKGTRAANFGILAAAAGVGFVLGPALGGALSVFGVRAPFFAAAGLILIAAVYGALVLPETLERSARRSFDWARANPIGGLMKVSEHRSVLGLMFALFLMQFAWHSFVVVWPYFTIEQFNWTEFEIGLAVTLYGLLMAIVQGGLTGPVTARFGNRKVGILSITLGIFLYAGYGVITEGWMAYVLILVSAPTALSGPILQTMITEQVDEDQQGELQGAIASIMGLTSIFGPYTMTQIFGIYTSDTAPIYLPGAPYLASAVLIILCLAAFVWSTRPVSSPSPGQSA